MHTTPISAVVAEDAGLARERHLAELRDALTKFAGGPTLSPLQTSQFLGVARSHVYELIRASQLPHIEVGGTYRVPASWLAEWMVAGGTKDATIAMEPVRRASCRKRSATKWAR